MVEANVISKKESYPVSSVLIIGNFLSASGRSRGVCEELSQRLIQAGWQVITASNKANRFLRLLDMVQVAWLNRHQYNIAHVDVYSGGGFLWAEVVCWVLRRIGKPYILTLRGGNLPNFAKRWPGRVERLLHSAKIVTAPSGYLYEQMQPYANKLILLPNPLDIGQYEFHLREQADPTLVWLRALHSIYNPVLAIRVVAKLVAEFPDIHLMMIGPDRGDGSLQAVEKAIAELGVVSNVTLVGGVPKVEVPKWLNKGDIFINTTNIDNTPVSVTEAMACGLCTISTNVGGIPYLLSDGNDALLVPPDDVEAMTAAVHSILVDANLSKQLSQAGRTTVEAFDWTTILPQWEKLLGAQSVESTS
ncbi:MAG: glycosyltransferase family 4 protein [Pseudomonadales bacterium]|nr:glycosyltransferase family 4 protein [Pseudomonadales bacterium]